MINFLKSDKLTCDVTLSSIFIYAAISLCTNPHHFSVVFDATTDVTAFSLSGNGSWGKSHTAGLDAAITNNAGSGVTGDIGITTTGFEAAETVSIVLILKKVSGYGSRTDYSG